MRRLYTTDPTSLQASAPESSRATSKVRALRAPVLALSPGISLTLPSALFFPDDNDHANVEIPETTSGVVDTIRWRLDLRPLHRARYGRVVYADLDDLTRIHGWRSVRLGASHSHTELVRFSRSTDGARIFLYESSVHAEVSVPRHAGYSNDEVHRVTEFEVLAFLRELENVLFRRTTAACATDRVQQVWLLSRLDLAIDFEADMAKIIETYRDSRHPRIRGLPEVYGRNGIAWHGKRHQLVIYKTDARPTRSKLNTVVPQHVDRPRSGGLVRAEFRFRGTAAIRGFVRSLRPLLNPALSGMIHAIAFDRGDAKGRAAPAFVQITNAGLHRVLAKELGAIEGAVRPLPPASCKNPIHGYGLIVLAAVPQTWSVIDEHYSTRRAHAIAKQVTQLRIRASRTRLVELAWREARRDAFSRPRAQAIRHPRTG